MNKQWQACLLVSSLLVSGWASAAELSPTDWPQWRGPARDGFIAKETSTWPDSLEGDRLKQLWRVELGEGYPGPIVVGDRVFVAETKNRKEEVVRAFDRNTGKQVWEAKWAGAMVVPFFALANGSWIRSTPACDGETLFVGGMRDVLVALNVADGSERWRVDFTERYKAVVPAFGFVCSPLVIGDFIYVQAGAGFCKLNKQTGESVWRVLDDSGGMWGSAFSSPQITTLGGKQQILVQTRTKLCGVDPESGDVLWEQEIPAFRGMNILTPTTFENGVLTSSYGGKTTLFQVARGLSRLAESAEQKGTDPFTVELAWEEKSQGYMSSPVFIDGHAYLHLRNRRFMCIDLKSGERKWTTTPFGEYWSLVAQGDRILALDERGELRLIRATPEKYEQLSERKISGEPTWGHLAVSGDQVFIRELKAIAAYRWE
jgi:outer membrane protein assembly factor BamB